MYVLQCQWQQSRGHCISFSKHPCCTAADSALYTAFYAADDLQLWSLGSNPSHRDIGYFGAQLVEEQWCHCARS